MASGWLLLSNSRSLEISRRLSGKKFDQAEPVASGLIRSSWFCWRRIRIMPATCRFVARVGGRARMKKERGEEFEGFRGCSFML